MRPSTKHTLWLAVALWAAPGLVLAGNIGNFNNFSARYVRTLNRNASTDNDAPAYNLAGTLRQPEGVSVLVSNQSWFRLDRLGYGGENYEATNPALLWPSLAATYNTGDWSAFVWFGVPSGGGAKFDDGHPLFSEQEDVVIEIANQMAVDTGQPPIINQAIAYDTQVRVAPLYLGAVVGGGYAINDMVSVGGGLKFVHTSIRYDGGARYEVFNKEIGGAPLGEAPVEVDVTQTDWGMGGTLGVHITPVPDLDVAIQYQSLVKLKLVNDTKVDDSGLFPDEATRRKDLPAIFNLGLAYGLGDARLEGSFNYYFNTQAKWGRRTNGERVMDSHTDGYEVGMAVEYQVLSELIASVGYVYQKTGHTADSRTSLSWGFDSHSVGGGVTWLATDIVNVTLGVLHAFDQSGHNADKSIYYTLQRLGTGIDVGFVL